MKIHVSHILVSQRYEADDVMRKIKEGRDFAELARRFSKCPSAKNGGDLGVIESSRLDERFAEAALHLKIGELSPIVSTSFGHHIIRRME